MVAWTTPLSILMAGARRRAGTVLAAAMLHGCYNGTIGMLSMLVIGGSVLIAVPMGVLMAVALTGLAALAAVGRRGQAAEPVRPAGAVPK